MNYKKIYDQLVEKCKVRGLNKSLLDGYYEKHHIIPRSLGGSNDVDNLVLLSGREHFIAHMLLMRAYPENVSLMRAAFMMSSRWQSGGLDESRPIHSKTYEKLRILYAQAVSVQLSGENNHMYGVRHPDHVMDRIKATRAKTERKNSLLRWKQNNHKYMRQFKSQPDIVQRFLYDGDSDFPVFRFKGDLRDWLSFYIYKDFWERCGNTGSKDFCTKVCKVSGKSFAGSYFNTMSKRFKSDFDPSSSSGYLVKALNNNSDAYIEELEKSLERTLEEIESAYINNWMMHRDEYRCKIESALDHLKVEKHKNTSKAKFSLIDLTEALILWRSGLVEQKYLAGLYCVARNSVSNALETEERWANVKSKISEIEEICFGGNYNYCASQHPPRNVFEYPRLG